MLISLAAVPPQLAPITFMGGTVVGQRAQATCLVLGGDQPVSLRWHKDGVTIGTQNSFGVNVKASSDFSSTVAIDETTGEHSGNYTCLARNVGGVAFSSAILQVNGVFVCYSSICI